MKSDIGSVTHHKGRRGLFYLVVVGPYHYIAAERTEAIVARQSLYHATIQDKQIKGALGMKDDRVPLNARLTVEQMRELGFLIYIGPGSVEGDIFVMNGDCKYGPFKRTDSALMGYIKMLQNDLDDMTEAYHREACRGRVP
jgi:hypothetical protein